jgi:glycine/D-amino acid oxidase-like deaminating enzyme
VVALLTIWLEILPTFIASVPPEPPVEIGSQEQDAGIDEAAQGIAAPARRDRLPRSGCMMLDVFPPLADLAVSHAWGGLVDITMNKAPDFGRLDATMYYVEGLSGHGLVLAAMAGRLVAEAIAGHPERFDLFARIRHHRFPGGRLMRAPLLTLGMAYYRLRDRL